MKKIITGAVIFMAIAFFFGGPVSAEEKLVGTWKTIADEGADKGKAKSYLDVNQVNGVYFAKIKKLLLKPQDTKCDKCVGALKDKPLIGMVIFSNMKKTGKVDKDFGEEYAGGKIMDPDNGKYYTCKFWIKGDVLVVRGYLAFFYRTQRWYRVKE
jgi:uncharacterized protein (DUF2147 family)